MISSSSGGGVGAEVGGGGIHTYLGAVGSTVNFALHVGKVLSLPTQFEVRALYVVLIARRTWPKPKALPTFVHVL